MYQILRSKLIRNMIRNIIDMESRFVAYSEERRPMKWIAAILAWIVFLTLLNGCRPDAPETIVLTKPMPQRLCFPDEPGFPGCECPPYCVYSPSHSRTVHFVVRYQSPQIGSDGDPFIVPALTAHSGSGQNEPKLPLDSALTFTVELDTNDVAVPSTRIHLAVFAVDSAMAGSDSLFGHHHHGATPKPTGRLSADTFTTDGTTGKTTVTYTASQYSGPIRLVVSSPATDSTLTKHWTVEVPGLVPMTTSGSHISLVGEDTLHPHSHYVLSSMIPALDSLAAKYYAVFNENLQVNDLSLQYGGKFDLKDNPFWRVDTAAAGKCKTHCEHRLGRSADIDGLSDTAKYNKVALWWHQQNIKLLVYDEAGKLHLRDWR